MSNSLDRDQAQHVTPYWVLNWVQHGCKNYCKFVNFMFANSTKTHICDIKNLRQGRDLPISVTDRVISLIREDFIFAKLRIFLNIQYMYRYY